MQQEGVISGDKPKRVSLTEEAFWELLRKNATPSNYDTIRNLFDKFTEESEIEVIPREQSIVMVLTLPETGQLIHLLHVNLDSKLSVWPRTVARQLSSAGFNDTLAKYYEEQMRRILHMPKDRVEFGCHISKVDVEKFKSTVKELMRRVRLRGNME